MKSMCAQKTGTAILGLLLAGAALAAPPPGSVQPSREMRDKMAQIHEKMAECLRSDRPFADCRQEMRNSCRADLGYQHCRMMQGYGMMGGGRRMMPPPAPPAPPSPPQP